MVKIDGIDVNFLSELSIDETYTTKMGFMDKRVALFCSNYFT